MLGRSVGLSDEKLAHVDDDPLPQGLYEEDEAAVIRYARRSTRMEPIDSSFYDDLTSRFSTEQVIELCFVVALSNFVNRFHATFLTDVDERTTSELRDNCPLRLPPMPSDSAPTTVDDSGAETSP